MFFVDIQDADAARFDAFARRAAPEARYERVPMLRGRIVSAHGVRAEELKAPPNAAWVLQSDRGITYANDVPAGSRVVAGEWWKPDYQGPPLVSFENKIAEGLGLKIGDPVVVNVLGRNITATLANLRAVDWQSLGINFVLVFSPGSFRGAPHTHIATFTYPGRHDASSRRSRLLKAAAAEFPTATAVRVREALDAVAKVVFDLTLAIRGASAVTLIAAVLVLAGALADRPPPPRLRCGGAEDARRDALAAARRLCARISRCRGRDRGGRRRGGLARRLHGHDRGDEPVLRVAAAPRARRHARRARG